MKHLNSINIKQIEFSILEKLYIGPGMGLGYFIYKFKSLDSFKDIVLLPTTLWYTKQARGPNSNSRYTNINSVIWMMICPYNETITMYDFYYIKIGNLFGYITWPLSSDLHPRDR